VRALRAAGFGILVKDASLGGQYPVMNVTLLNPHDQGCFSSFGAHPRFEIALERALTELLQGRALDTLNEFPERAMIWMKSHINKILKFILWTPAGLSAELSRRYP